MFNMKECRTGDKLLSKHGMILIYEEYLPLEYCPHIIRYPNKAKGSRTDEGYLYSSPAVETTLKVFGELSET